MKITFSSPVATAEFSKFSDIIECRILISTDLYKSFRILQQIYKTYFTNLTTNFSKSFRILNSSAGILSPPLALLIEILRKPT